MAAKSETYREHWSREGFYGAGFHIMRPLHVPDFHSVQGPHAPHRLQIGQVVTPDGRDAEALPTTVMISPSGVRISISARSEPMPFLMQNVEADEVYFVQSGELGFATIYGNITGRAGDFVFIPRAIPYQIQSVNGPALALVIESPGGLRFDARPEFSPKTKFAHIKESAVTAGEVILLVKSFDGITRYVKPYSPLAVASVGDDASPVWKLALKDIPPNPEGHPTQFAASPNNDELLYTLSARQRRRPPIHYNADYDEVVYYFVGPGAWGKVTEPGTLTWVPKGIAHHGPSEDVAEGYLAWMLESRTTLRLTDVGKQDAQLMETDYYGVHPSVVSR